jgi:uncharacterized protein (TIGR03435 family)
MTRALIGVGVAALWCAVTFAQSAEPKRAFEATDVHVSPRSAIPTLRVYSRARRYEIRNATLLELIRTAYSVDAERILGGPNWLDYDHFDVVAIAPPNTTLDGQKSMLQSLLAERFALVLRRETKPAAGHVLALGKGKHKLKEAADSAATPGCQAQSVPSAPSSGVPGQIVLPMTALACHNVTMEAFAADLKRLSNGYVTNAVLDETGLKGAWDFEVKFTQRALLSLAANLDGASVTSLSDAIDKQLGLKLEERDIPTPAIVVERANATPTPNAPDIDKKLPPSPIMEFEVADIKPVDPNARRTGPLQMVSPSGRVNLPGIPLKLVILLAWSLPTVQSAELIGAPKWLDSANFDIIAKLPSDLTPANGTNVPLQELGPALQALLIDRFKMKVHFEDRSVDAYTLVAVKPKLKKADPSTRTGCKPAANAAVVLGARGVPNRTINCQNITMAQFAEQLGFFGAAFISHPVVNATGLEGAWDFALSFSPIPPGDLARILSGARGALPPASPGGTADLTAADPIGGGVSLFEAVEKQLGLKLETQKRTYPVFVIDHIDEKPTDN